MTDDGLRPRWPLVAILATALITTILLLVPANVVSYKNNVALATTTAEYVLVSEVRGENPLPESDVTIPAIPMYDPETERLLYAIGMCESGGQQFRPDGSVVKNPNSSATGKYQLMASIWRPIAERMGYDIDTEAGNKAMAYYILTEAQGIQAWKASRTCLAAYNIHI